jgi:hypothetical protein
LLECTDRHVLELVRHEVDVVGELFETRDIVERTGDDRRDLPAR